MSSLNEKLERAQPTITGRARASLQLLQRWHHWEVIKGLPSDPDLIVTTGASRFLWRRVSKELYERIDE